jgi:hypothetical protein
MEAYKNIYLLKLEKKMLGWELTYFASIESLSLNLISLFSYF